MGVSILGTGKYLPQRVITNEDFMRLVDTSDEWITSRTGIHTRHVATQENTWQMGAAAAKNALASAGVSPESIGVVLVSSVSADYITPSISCMIANECGISGAICYDINVACSGFVYALDMARRYLQDDDRQNALVISAEMMTKITDYSDRATCVLFGDGAGAAVITKADKPFFGFFGSDPTGVPNLFARGIPPKNPFMEAPYDRHKDGFADTTGFALYQNGKEVYKFATRTLPMAVEEVCKKAGITPAELSLIVPHQANLRIIETAAKNLGLPMEKFFVNIAKYGNMSSACIPIGLCEAIEEGRIKRGDKVCVAGFGAGLVYAACLFEY